MARSFATDRRTVLRLVGLGATGGALSTAAGALGRQFAFVQDGECVPVDPLSGDEPVEELYDYRLPTDQFEARAARDGSTFSSHGTTDLQRDDTSTLFLYDGPRGLSLVVVHGRLAGDGAGGTVSFTLRGLPADGEWVVRDDDYFVDGEPAPSNVDRWDVDGAVQTIDWGYRGGRTDGGAFRGLDGATEVRIDPAFNEAASLSDELDVGPVTSWEVLSGDLAAPERRPLDLDRPVAVRAGECPDDARTPSRKDDGEIDARITGLSVAGGVYRPGDEVPATVRVRNTGDRDHTFVVGYSAVDPRGTGYHNDCSTDQDLTVSAGETRTTTVTWIVEDDAPTGTYDAAFIVWRRRNGRCGLQGNLDRRYVSGAFRVVNDR